MVSKEEKHMIVRGKDGYLFQTDEFIFQRLSGETNLTPEDLGEWNIELAKRKQITVNSGGKYLLFVVPERHVIYHEFLPNGITVSDDRPIMRLLKSSSGECILYPDGSMQAGRKLAEPYPKGGSHWNGWGAYIGYRSICRRLDLIPDPSDCFEWTHDPVPGGCDLDERLSEPIRPYSMFKKKFSHGRCVFDNTIWTMGNLKVFKNSNENLPTLVLFRDSFSMIMLPLLAESFSRIVAVAAGPFYRDIVESERPDFVITEIAERWITTTLADKPKSSTEDCCQVSLQKVSEI
jgi:hypothetical protein